MTLTRRSPDRHFIFMIFCFATLIMLPVFSVHPRTLPSPESPRPAQLARDLFYSDPLSDEWMQNYTAGSYGPAPPSLYNPHLDMVNATLLNATSVANYTVTLTLAAPMDTGSTLIQYYCNVFYTYVYIPPQTRQGEVELFAGYQTVTSPQFTAKHILFGEFKNESLCAGAVDDATRRITWTFPKAWVPAYDNWGNRIDNYSLEVVISRVYFTEQYCLFDNSSNAVFSYLPGNTGGIPDPDGEGDPMIWVVWALVLGGGAVACVFIFYRPARMSLVKLVQKGGKRGQTAEDLIQQPKIPSNEPKKQTKFSRDVQKKLKQYQALQKKIEKRNG